MAVPRVFPCISASGSRLRESTSLSSPPPVSAPSVSPLLPSLVSSQICLAGSRCCRELQTAGNWHTDGRTDGRSGEDPGVFSALANFIPSNLSPTCVPPPPLPALHPSLSVPLNPYFVFCCSSDRRRRSSLSPALSLRRHPSPPFIPLTLPLTRLHSFFPRSPSFCCVHHPTSPTDRSQEKRSKAPQVHTEEGTLMCGILHVRTQVVIIGSRAQGSYR